MASTTPPAPVTRLAHTCIRTSNLSTTHRFYCDVLGMEHLFDFFRAGEVVGSYFKITEGQYIEVFYEPRIETDSGSHVLFHFCLECADIHATRQKLVDAGYKPEEIKLGKDQTYQFWVTDPNGMRVEFQQYTPSSSQFTGQAVVW
ncbi:MAG: VOC family protein [Verrucomicrobiota bacterium JB022]|nr:VOC family protein [Verrucomicrobiota bacterium JB022]